MTVFWLIAVAMVVAALGFILPPLLGTGRKGAPERKQINVALFRQRQSELEAELSNGTIDQAQFATVCKELEQQLLQDVPGTEQTSINRAPGRNRWVVLGLAVGLPALAFSMYLKLGSIASLSPDQAGANVAAVHPGARVPDSKLPSIDEMVASLQARLKTNPNDAQGWAMLGRSYGYLGEYRKAAAAYAKATALIPNNAQLWVDYADVLGVANNRQLSGKPMEMIQKALALDPNQPKALWLAGTASFQSGDYAGAIHYWNRLRAVIPKGSEDARRIEAIIADAESRIVPDGAKQASGTAAAGKASGHVESAVSSIHGVVSLAPALASQAKPTDTVFIFARAASGPRMPLAVLRKQVKDLPFSFTLDDSMAMTPQMKLSNYPEVVISAHVSKSGTARVESGDLQGTSPAIKVGTKQEIHVLIDKTVP